VVVVKPIALPKKAPMSNDMTQRILRRVPYQEGFRFSKGIGDYTGQVATSLDDFAEMLKTIDLKSIDFHMERNDFEKWVLGVFGDEELGHMINRRANFVGENRRNELITTVKAHLEDLRKMPKSV
jgi:hypothetical protein